MCAKRGNGKLSNFAGFIPSLFFFLLYGETFWQEIWKWNKKEGEGRIPASIMCPSMLLKLHYLFMRKVFHQNESVTIFFLFYFVEFRSVGKLQIWLSSEWWVCMEARWKLSRAAAEGKKFFPCKQNGKINRRKWFITFFDIKTSCWLFLLFAYLIKWYFSQSFVYFFGVFDTYSGWKWWVKIGNSSALFIWLLANVIVAWTELLMNFHVFEAFILNSEKDMIAFCGSET